MWNQRSKLSVAAGAACAMSLFACASSPPKELTNAREAYNQAQSGPAAQWNPAQLHEAKKTLQLAEQTFEEEGDSARTRDRAYIAQRKAQLAEVHARITHNEARLEALQKEMTQEQRQRLGELRESYAEQQARLQEVERARKEAEQRAKQASEDLARIAQVKEEPRGTVITISGSVLFASGEAELLPPAQVRLSKVAKALQEKSPGSMIVVEGHTDTQGSAEFNLDLSERRAKSVREFLVAQGVPEDRIQAKGVGFAQPIAPNKTAEGRANNRRVEIILQPPSSASSSVPAAAPQDETKSDAQG